MTSALVVPCPRCQKKVAWAGNPERPFCSSACRRNDWGNWLLEKYVVPTTPEQPPEDEANTDRPPLTNAYQAN